MQTEKSMTKIGDEKTMVVESPKGRREKEVKMKRSRKPPVRATRNIKIVAFLSLGPRKEFFLYMAIPPMSMSWKTPLITTTCMLSISTRSLIMLE